jgi:carboxyl-terminal processing protease
MNRLVVLVAALSSPLAACGDGDAEFPPASQYAARCTQPRTGIDPDTQQPYRDVQGSLLDEQLWLRSWTHDLYLWYAEVPYGDPKRYASAVDYFDDLRTPEKTASGKPKDQFHFTYTTPEWIALSRSGIEASYGVQWSLISSTPPRKLVVAFTEPGSPGADAGIDRGAEVLTIDGVNVATSSDTATLNRGLSPSALGETHTFVVRDRGATAPRTVTLTSASITSTPVQHVGALPAPHASVGYLVFNDHIATAERGLRDAITALRAAAISELVIDLRYNGGGYLAIAAQLAYMIAGPAATAGKAFEREVFNDKHTQIDPFTARPLEAFPFATTTLGLSTLPAGQPLPALGLKRVFVLTGPGTCSASEAMMNGLAGIDVEVIQIGATTCGKPYGFFPADNCGITYFSIQFQGVNHKGFGDYADGFVPDGVLKGCVVADDFSHALGDPAEARLAAALSYMATGRCPSAATSRSRAPLAAVEGELVKPAWRTNRIMTPRR